MHRNEEQSKFQCRIISIANANTHWRFTLADFAGPRAEKEIKSVSCAKVTMLSISITAFCQVFKS